MPNQKSKKNEKDESQAAIVQLVGDMKQNIDQLIKKINCQCGANNHLKVIFNIYCNKIQKLRAERDELRQKCEQLSHLQKIYIKQSHTISNGNDYESTSLSFKNQLHDQFGSENKSVFDILNKQMVLPISLNAEKQTTLHYSDTNQYLLTQDNIGVNPEDSMLLTQSSARKSENKQEKFSLSDKMFLKPLTKEKQMMVRNFEQFLRQKVQQNHNNIKISQDYISLNVSQSRKHNKSPNRKPLMDKMTYNN